jgi:hypothetical protein
MASVALSGNDTVSLNNYTFTNLATGDVVMLTFPNEIAQVKTGKNGNSVYGLNETGKQCELKLRVLRGSADDKFLQSLLNAQQGNFASTVLMQGTFIKKIGDGQGNITSDTYIVSGGVFTKQVEGKMNVEGDEQQSIAEYQMRFSNSPRTLT